MFNIADVLTTFVGITLLGFTEENPLYAWVLNTRNPLFILLGFLPKAGIVAFVFLVALSAQTEAKRNKYLRLLVWIFGFAPVWNLVQIIMNLLTRI